MFVKTKVQLFTTSKNKLTEKMLNLMELFIILAIFIEGISGLSMYALFSLSGCTKENDQCQNAKFNSDRMLKMYNPKVDDIERICVRDIKEDVKVL